MNTAETVLEPRFHLEIAPSGEPEYYITGSYSSRTAIESQPNQRVYLTVDSSTSKHILGVLLQRSISEIFASAKDEEFEYGQTSNFSIYLDRLIHRYSFDALREIQNVLSEQSTNPDLIVEALHTLGRSTHQETLQHRLIILLLFLQSSLPVIRAGAALGIACMDDPQAIPTLERILARETSAYAKVWLERVLQQLQETQLHM